MVLRISLAFVVAVCWTFQFSSACSCAALKPKQALNNAKVVFIGEVVAREDVKAGGYIYTFKVLRKYKGVQDATLKIRTSGRGGDDCGFTADAGKKMLVYAHRYENGDLYTDICMRTRDFKDAGEDVKELGEGEEVK
jgi:hypothetical protein